MGDGGGTGEDRESAAGRVADGDVAGRDAVAGGHGADSVASGRDASDSATAARAVAEAVGRALADGTPAWASAVLSDTDGAGSLDPDVDGGVPDSDRVAARLVARTLREAVRGDVRSPGAVGTHPSALDLPHDVATALRDLTTAVAAADGERALERPETVARAYGAVVPAASRRDRGEYYTPRPVRDLLARRCVTAPDDRVLDPACGTGGFLASAARRKRALASGDAGAGTSGGAKTRGGPADRDSLVGVEVAPDPAGLAAASLPADVRVADFFDVTPADLGGPFDAVVGNPPYVRHEAIADDAAVRAHLERVGARDLSRRADLYVYFLTRAVEFLAPGGDLGFVVSDRWLDTRYGEDLQRFLLDNTAIRTVVTFDRGVFDDALVDASLVLVRRRNDAARDRTVTRFVRVREGADVGSGMEDATTEEGVAAETDDAATETGEVAADHDAADHDADHDAAATRDRPPDRLVDGPVRRVATRRQADLRAESKWNAYHIAPPVFFDLRRDPGTVALSALADVHYGVKTGANDFFVSRPDEWAARDLGPYATPFLKATGQVETVEVSPADADGWRVLDAHDAAREAGLLSEDVGASSGTDAVESLSQADNPALARYVARGERADYHERPSLSSREPWFDLGPLPRPRLLATTFTWRVHRVHWNAAGAVPSDQFYAIRPDDVDPEVLGGVLNSRPVWLASEVLGRRAGGEGMTRLQTKVYEAERWPVPDPRAMTDARRERVRAAFRALRERERALVESTSAEGATAGAAGAAADGSATGTDTMATATAPERDALDRAVLGALALDGDVGAVLDDVRHDVRTLVARRTGETAAPDERSVAELPPVDGDG